MPLAEISFSLKKREALWGFSISMTRGRLTCNNFTHLP